MLLILRAFASGSVALTGTEAVSNGVPAFKPPEARNAGTVLILMGAFFAHRSSSGSASSPRSSASCPTRPSRRR